MDHQQLAARMLCSWGLVKAYQWTQQSAYVCPPTPHILEAYNHKVNHDTHKELNLQEHAVLQYVHALQYVSYCNDARYRDSWAPAVKDFWAEVVEPFGSRALHNFDPSHLLGDTMCPNQGAKILDYGVRDHITHVCTPFFEGIESRSQYENRRCRQEEEHRCTQMALGDHHSLSHGPNRRTWELDERRPEMTKQGGQSRSESRRRQGVREQQSHSVRKGPSWTLRGMSPHDPSGPWDQKLPTPPQPSWDKMVKEPEAWQTAFKEAMELSRSPSMSWQDQVQKEEEWQMHVKGSPD